VQESEKSGGNEGLFLPGMRDSLLVYVGVEESSLSSGVNLRNRNDRIAHLEFRTGISTRDENVNPEDRMSNPRLYPRDGALLA